MTSVQFGLAEISVQSALCLGPRWDQLTCLPAAAETEAAKDAKERETKRLDERVLTLTRPLLL